MTGGISERIAKYLTPKSPSRTPIFYGLPKIHKNNIPLRPIVSACDSPTENLASFIDYISQPVMKSLQSYIRDTRDFITQILELPPLPPNSYLVTADVVSLYTNIPHQEGTEAFIKKLGDLKNILPLDTPPLTHVHTMLDFILTHNCFEFLG